MQTTHAFDAHTPLKTSPTLTVSGVSLSCPRTLMRVLDNLLVVGCRPVEIEVRRRAATFRFRVTTDGADVPADRLGALLLRIVGVRAVVVRRPEP